MMLSPLIQGFGRGTYILAVSHLGAQVQGNSGDQCLMQGKILDSKRIRKKWYITTYLELSVSYSHSFTVLHKKLK